MAGSLCGAEQSGLGGGSAIRVGNEITELGLLPPKSKEQELNYFSRFPPAAAAKARARKYFSITGGISGQRGGGGWERRFGRLWSKTKS